MNTRIKHNSNFYLDFFENRNIPEPYKSVWFKHDIELLKLNNDDLNDQILNTAYITALIPEYLKLETYNGVIQKKIRQSNLGYSIDLTNITCVRNYVIQHFKKRSKNILNRRKRLYDCFDINIKVLNEGLSKEEFEFLMSNFKKMLVNRFNQRNDKNKKLNEWELQYQSIYPKLLKNHASLFVIYDKLKPIHISLLYHIQKITISSIPAYDIDYHKFGLGNIAVYEKLAWCLMNGHKIYDMGYGDLEYKIRWSNFTYNYEQLILINNKFFLSRIIANFIHVIYKCKELLKKRKFNDQLYKLIYFFRKKEILPKKKSIIFEYADLSAPQNSGDSKLIDINTNKFYYLRRPVYDFLYQHSESSEKTKVFEVKGKNDSFYVLGERKQRLIKVLNK